MATPSLAGLTPTSGGSSSSTLSDWAGPYVTDMLGKAQAIADEPYQVYQGPMTAGQSNLQSKVFQGLGNLSFPGILGQSFSSPMRSQQPYPAQIPGTGGGLPPGALGMPMRSPADIAYEQQFAQQGPSVGGVADAVNAPASGYSPEMPELNQLDPSVSHPNMPMGGSYGDTPEDMGAYNPDGSMPMGSGTLGTAQTGMPQQGGISGLSLQPPQGSQQPSNIAQSYMNPYLQSVLDPQMAELRRQNDITNMQTNAKLTGAGAFGGGRQAIMNAENNRNLMQEMNKTVGQGYANAYDKAMGQFNVEQGQAKTLADMMSEQGQQERNIEQQGISADYNEFLAQRDDPMKKTQYLQSMLQGLPISTVTNTAAQQSGIGQLASTMGGLGSIADSLKKFNLTGG